MIEKSLIWFLLLERTKIASRCKIWKSVAQALTSHHVIFFIWGWAKEPVYKSNLKKAHDLELPIQLVLEPGGGTESVSNSTMVISIGSRYWIRQYL